MKKKRHHNGMSAGVDALTITSRTKETAEQINGIGYRAIQMEKTRGSVEHTVNYHGYKGVRCGSVMSAQNDEGQAFLQITGGEAQYFGPMLPREGVNVTRIDVQVTFQLSAYDGGLAERLGKKAIEARKTAVGKNWPSMRLQHTYGAGDTLNIGSRKSERYGRLYDKWKESKDSALKNCWRAEIEFKEGAAMNVWSRLHAEIFDPTIIHSIVQTQFAHWLIDVPIRKFIEMYIPGSGRNDATLDDKLKWIKEQVFPTMELLCDNGYRQEVMQLFLDLPE